jgi:hypothetical protein
MALSVIAERLQQMDCVDQAVTAALRVALKSSEVVKIGVHSADMGVDAEAPKGMPQFFEQADRASSGNLRHWSAGAHLRLRSAVVRVRTGGLVKHGTAPPLPLPKSPDGRLASQEFASFTLIRVRLPIFTVGRRLASISS